MLTVAHARGVLHQVVDANDPYNPKFLSFLNQACDRFHKAGPWRGLRAQRELPIVDGLIVLEREWETLVGVLHNDIPRPVNAEMFEFVVGGPGYVNAEYGIGGWLVDQGEDEEGRRVYKIGKNYGQKSPVIRGLLKRRFLRLKLETDEVRPANIGALKEGLHAVMMEDASDMPRAQQHWTNALAALDSELGEHHAGEKPAQQTEDLGIPAVQALN